MIGLHHHFDIISEPFSVSCIYANDCCVSVREPGRCGGPGFFFVFRRYSVFQVDSNLVGTACECLIKTIRTAAWYKQYTARCVCHNLLLELNVGRGCLFAKSLKALDGDFMLLFGRSTAAILQYNHLEVPVMPISDRGLNNSISGDARAINALNSLCA